MEVPELRVGRAYLDIHMNMVVLREIRGEMARYLDGTGQICTMPVRDFAAFVIEEWRMSDDTR